MSDVTPAVLWTRRGLLLVGAGAALTAAQAGLVRLGVAFGWGPSFAALHGPLFVVGLFGTVISLERAVAVGGAPVLIVPGIAAATVVALLARHPIAPWLSVVAALGMVAITVAVIRRQSLPFTWLMLAGSAVLLLGNVAWAMGRGVAEVAPSWLGFFVLTIVAERLELSRLAPTPRWAGWTVLGLCLLFALLTAGSLALGPTVLRVGGAVLALIGAWQLRFDLARRTVRQRGLPRFTALGVLCGAGWLVVAGLAMAVWDMPAAGPRADAVLHAVFVGFVVSMVFAHAPIILPAVARIAVPMHVVLYAPLAVLQLGLVMRLAGDLGDSFELRRVGGVANAVALALFLLAVLISRSRLPVRQGHG
jgi:hypothetical protein